MFKLKTNPVCFVYIGRIVDHHCYNFHLRQTFDHYILQKDYSITADMLIEKKPNMMYAN
jgi:hypothetical protein